MLAQPAISQRWRRWSPSAASGFGRLWVEALLFDFDGRLLGRAHAGA
jgi:hypothetical protein